MVLSNGKQATGRRFYGDLSENRDSGLRSLQRIDERQLQGLWMLGRKPCQRTNNAIDLRTTDCRAILWNDWVRYGSKRNADRSSERDSRRERKLLRAMVSSRDRKSTRLNS